MTTFDNTDVVKHFVNRSLDIHKQVGELRLMSEFDLQWLPPSYLKHNTKSSEITEAWGKLPLNIRNNEEIKTYLLCTKHWNLPSWECHFDGPSPQKRNCVQSKKMNIAKAFVICPYNPKHKVLRKNLLKHKFKSHPVLYKRDLDASYKMKLDAEDAAGYAVNYDEMKRLNELSKAIGEPEYWH
ncbi:hypothetical protein FQA39_LY08814 [Lamprigera yunnana]|nr:hypothetical protein FQA39_LY08814 [Lamprigera yunnana]